MSKYTPTLGQLALREFISDLKAESKQLRKKTGKDVDLFADMADRIGVTPGHILNVAYSSRQCTAALAIALERESKGAIICEEICPDPDWDYIRGRKKPSSD